MKITNLGKSRKIDGVGRIGIPKKIRDTYGLNTDTSLDWYEISDGDKTFLAFPVDKILKSKEYEEYLRLRDKFNGR